MNKFYIFLSIPIVIVVLGLAFSDFFRSSTITDKQKELPQTQTTFDRQSVSVNKEKSYIAFTGTKGPVKHQGNFKKFNVSIKNPQDLSEASVNADIDITSLDTKIAKLNTHLLSPDFFDAKNYPKATFISTSVSKVGNNQYKFKGDLTIRETTKSVTLNVIVANEYALIKYDLNCIEFGVCKKGLTDAIVPLDIKLIFQ